MIDDGMNDDMLSAYLDGECTPEQRAAVEARLASDPEWQAQLDEITEARDALRALPLREVPPGFFESMTLDAAADEAPRAHTSWALRALAVVGVAAAIAFAFMLATPSNSGPEVTPAIATMSDAHGATASFENDPAVGIAPVAVPVSFGR